MSWFNIEEIIPIYKIILIYTNNVLIYSKEWWYSTVLFCHFIMFRSITATFMFRNEPQMKYTIKV